MRILCEYPDGTLKVDRGLGVEHLTAEEWANLCDAARAKAKAESEEPKAAAEPAKAKRAR